MHEIDVCDFGDLHHSRVGEGALHCYSLLSGWGWSMRLTPLAVATLVATVAAPAWAGGARTSATTSSPSCSIRSGNAFAG